MSPPSLMGHRVPLARALYGSWLGELLLDRLYEVDQLPVTFAANVAPVSNSVTSPERAADSMALADCSVCPFTVLAKGNGPGVGVWQLPLVMPPSLQQT